MRVHSVLRAKVVTLVKLHYGSMTQEGSSLPPLWSAHYWRIIDWHGVITHTEVWMAFNTQWEDLIAQYFFTWPFTIHQLEVSVHADLDLTQSLKLASLKKKCKLWIVSLWITHSMLVLYFYYRHKLKTDSLRAKHTFIIWLWTLYRITQKHVCPHIS